MVAGGEPLTKEREEPLRVCRWCGKTRSEHPDTRLDENRALGCWGQRRFYMEKP
jgi:hypothetical protein